MPRSLLQRVSPALGRLNQVGRPHLEGFGDSDKDGDRRVFLAALDRRNVGSIQVRREGQLFLGELRLLARADAPYVLGNDGDDFRIARESLAPPLGPLRHTAIRAVSLFIGLQFISDIFLDPKSLVVYTGRCPLLIRLKMQFTRAPVPSAKRRAFRSRRSTPLFQTSRISREGKSARQSSTT